jgi:hypothetical protein
LARRSHSFLAAAFHTDYVGTVSLFWALLMVWAVFGDGGLAIAGPYAAEVWPSSIRATGMGSAYGFGGIGKIIGPLGLALIIGSSSVIKPDVSLKAIIPAFLYFACFSVGRSATKPRFHYRGNAHVMASCEAKSSKLRCICKDLERLADITGVRRKDAERSSKRRYRVYRHEGYPAVTASISNHGNIDASIGK